MKYSVRSYSVPSCCELSYSIPSYHTIQHKTPYHPSQHAVTEPVMALTGSRSALVLRVQLTLGRCRSDVVTWCGAGSPQAIATKFDFQWDHRYAYLDLMLRLQKELVGALFSSARCRAIIGLTSGRCRHASWDTIPYRTIPHRTLPNCTVPYYTIPNHTIPYHTNIWPADYKYVVCMVNMICVLKGCMRYVLASCSGFSHLLTCSQLELFSATVDMICKSVPAMAWSTSYFFPH